MYHRAKMAASLWELVKYFCKGEQTVAPVGTDQICELKNKSPANFGQEKIINIFIYSSKGCFHSGIQVLHSNLCYKLLLKIKVLSNFLHLACTQ